MPKKKGLHIAFIVGFALLTTSLHFLIFQRQSPHVILEELFYIPLLLAAVVFGLKGSLLTYLFISALYIPFFFGQWSATFLEFTERLLHLLFTGLFAFLAGIFVERKKKYQKQREEDRHLAAIGQAAAAIVHDLKNPLIVVLAFAKRIKDKRTNPETGIEPIIEAAENIQMIRDSGMDFARPVVLKMKPEDMRDVILRACRSCRTKAEERAITLSTDFPSQPVFLGMDGLRLERAFANLIHNSVDASGQGQSIILSLAEEKKFIEARIKDSGTGMDQETLDNLYIPFYSKKKGGTGLGMAIVKKIVEGHQGKIRVHSRPGLGTEVIVTLPNSKADLPVHREKSSEPSCGKPLDREEERGSDNSSFKGEKR